LEQDAFPAPRLLCWHRSSFHIQQAHPHPRFTPDGASVLFTSDHLGYCNVHTVRAAEFDSLPEARAD
jgi:oligogalacturonide lyase